QQARQSSNRASLLILVFDAREEPRVKRAILLVTVFIIVPTIAAANPGVGACDPSATLSRHLEQAFPGWRLVTHTKLPSERRARFVRDHPAACPGRVSMNFFGDARPTVALSLWRPGKALLVLARE